MKKKIGTVLDDEVFRNVKRKAVEEGRSLSDVIQDALERYLIAEGPEPSRRRAGFEAFCARPLRIGPDQFRAVLEEDPWDR